MKTWDELTARYVAHLRELRRSRTTLTATQRYLEKLREYVLAFGAARPADVTEEHVEAFSQRLRFEPGPQGKLYSPSTVQNTLQMLRLFFRWAVRERLLLTDPFRDVRLQRVRHFERRRWLSVDEVNRLLLAPPNYTLPGLRDRAILEALYGAGLRREECSMLDVRDVDFELGALHVRFAKGGEERLQPMGETLQAALRTYLERCRPTLMRRKKDDGALFVQITGTRVPPHGIGSLVRQHAERAGLGRVTAHHLRHAFATHLVENGADLVAVQHLLGHARLQSTAIYTGVTPQQVADDHRKTHPRARRKRARKPSPPSS